MKIRKDIVQSGSNTVAGYSIDGVLRQAAPIENAILFICKSPGTSERIIDVSGIGFPVQLLSIWAKFTSLSGNSLEFTIKDPITNSTTFQEIITEFPCTFPFIVAQPNGIACIKGITALEEVWILAKPIDILDVRSF